MVCRGIAEAADSADRHSPRLVQTVNHKSQAEYHTGSWWLSTVLQATGVSGAC